MTFKISNIGRSLMSRIMNVSTNFEAVSNRHKLAYYAWDSRGDEAELPTHDLIGLSGWTFRENGGLWLVHVGITLSTFNDENLFREMEIIDHIHDLFGENCVVPLYDEQDREYTQLLVTEFEMLAAGTSEKRNFRPIGLELKRTSNG